MAAATEWENHEFPDAALVDRSRSLPAQVVLDALSEGGLAIIAESRRDAGGLLYLVAAGRSICPGIVNRMAKEGRGVISLALSQKQARRLGLHRLGGAKTQRWSWGVSASIEARCGVGTGISARDRARTIAVASALEATPDDIVSPGHVFPILAHPEGLLDWQAAAEAAVDATDLAGRGGAAALCHILTDTGEAATWADLPALSGLHGVPVATISDILISRHSADDSFRHVFAAAFQ